MDYDFGVDDLDDYLRGINSDSGENGMEVENETKVEDDEENDSEDKVRIKEEEEQEEPEVVLVRRRKPRKRIFWSREELAALERGMRICGTGWAEIIERYGTRGRINNALKGKTAAQLKDKARNEKKRRMRSGIALGPFSFASG